MRPEITLCISSFFSAWGDRMWSFAVGLYMIKLTPGSLQLAAIYGLVLTGSGVLFAPVVGDWIDRTKRLKVVRIVLLLQNLLVIICAVVISIYLFLTNHPQVLELLKALIIILGALANLAGQGEKLAVTRDWIVVVVKGDQALLASTNANLRRIDLSVAITAPIAVGFLMSVVSDVSGIAFICSWNVISMVAEYLLLNKVYKAVPELADKVPKDSFSSSNQVTEDNKNEVSAKTRRLTTNLNFLHRFKSMISGWVVYKRQSIVLAGMALASLYLTVLGFNAITTGYAYSQGLSELIVSVCFGLGSLVGIAGTFLFPWLHNKFGLVKAGFFGFFSQWTMLLLCVASIWVRGSPSDMLTHDKENSHNMTSQGLAVIDGHFNTTTTPAKLTEMDYTSVSVLMAGIILSRAGLWIIDLTITQLQQENVPEDERGVVGGVQYSFNSILDLLHFIVTIFLPKPQQFGYLILMSVSAVTLAGIIYIIFAIRFKKVVASEKEHILKKVKTYTDNA